MGLEINNYIILSTSNILFWLSYIPLDTTSPTLYIHTQCILSCTVGGKQAARGREGARETRRWEGRREQGAGWRDEAMM